VHKSSCKLTDRLGEYNRTVLQKMISNEETLKELVEAVIHIAKKAFPNSRYNLDVFLLKKL